LHFAGFTPNYRSFVARRGFQSWADYAIEMRNKAPDGKAENDEYVREMKK
jgi:hypothetical protein